MQHLEAVKIHKLKIHMQAVYMKEERLHHGQCQRRLIVRGYTSGNCMKEERCTLMPVAAITDASSLSVWRSLVLRYMRRTGSDAE